jgi:hypothetical protein
MTDPSLPCFGRPTTISAEVMRVLLRAETEAGPCIRAGVQRSADIRADECGNRQLEQRHVAFHSLREAIDTTTANGRLQLHLFAALAEFERELIRERSQAGREVAKAAGRLGGRPMKLTAEKKAAALAMRDRGDMSMAQIARALGVRRTTLYDHLDLPPLDGIPREQADDKPGDSRRVAQGLGEALGVNDDDVSLAAAGGPQRAGVLRSEAVLVRDTLPWSTLV